MDKKPVSYMERENAILNKLKATNYAIFDGDKDSALSFLDSQLDRFPNYANIVIRQQQLMRIWQARYEGQDFRDHVADFDRQRHDAHEGAIDSVNILNRLSERLDLGPFAEVDTSDRYAVADFVGDYIGELYKTGTRGMDQAVYQKDAPYDTKKLDARRRAVANLTDGLASPEEQEMAQL